MSESTAPKITKWPFIVGDVALLLMAWLVYYESDPNTPFNGLEAFWCFACVAAGAWVMVLPYLREFQARADLTEASELAASVEKISSLEALTKQVENATEQWLHVEDRANEINATSKEIAGKINAEAREFTEFLQNANDTEKKHLRLEVDKLNRAQVDWVKVVTGMLDHVFALNQAGRQSGQEKLIRQLDNFQIACRDVARRVGVVTHEAKPDECFDGEKHQLRDPEAEPESGAKIIGIAAQGLTHQGQMLRKTIVVIEGEELGQASSSNDKSKAKAKKKA
ncbi:MAG: hypothetical protein CMO75_06805 [Verrucomicrobiales bacterium]|nr:hypothetical protein [Verrucomicrobiales bacterium]|tara:strand:- start:1837 stop:2679 length:843 start_codon:yes stop_codon:yes gene_type:complete